MQASPCCDDVRQLRSAGRYLHCDRLEKHQFLMSADGVGASGHVLQSERTVLFSQHCGDKNSTGRCAYRGLQRFTGF